MDHLKLLPPEAQDGALNYTLTKMLRELYPRKYFHQNRALGVLTAVLQEHYRTITGRYEDEKIVSNGDVIPNYDSLK